MHCVFALFTQSQVFHPSRRSSVRLRLQSSLCTPGEVSAEAQRAPELPEVLMPRDWCGRRRHLPTQQTSLALSEINRSSLADPPSSKPFKGEHASHLWLQGLCPGGLRIGRLCSSVTRDPSLQLALFFFRQRAAPPAQSRYLLQLLMVTFTCQDASFCLEQCVKVNPKSLAVAP